MDDNFCTFESSNSVCVILPSFFAFTCFDCFAPIVFLGNGSAFVSMRPLPHEGVGGFTVAAIVKVEAYSGF